MAKRTRTPDDFNSPWKDALQRYLQQVDWIMDLPDELQEPMTPMSDSSVAPLVGHSCLFHRDGGLLMRRL